MTRTIKEIDFDIKREAGKRDQHMELGTPASMMLALDHQNNIDALLEEKKALEAQYSVKVFEQVPTHIIDSFSCDSNKPIGYSKVTVMNDKVRIETTIFDPKIVKRYQESDLIVEIKMGGHGVKKEAPV